MQGCLVFPMAFEKRKVILLNDEENGRAIVRFAELHLLHRLNIGKCSALPNKPTPKKPL